VSSTTFLMVSACRVLDFKAAIPMTLRLAADDIGQLELDGYSEKLGYAITLTASAGGKW
jgi:hypothetical protein